MDNDSGGPSDQDIAEAHRLLVLHNKSQAVDACLWCREAWPCRFRAWADEVMDASREQP